jgi:hypothetical protein
MEADAKAKMDSLFNAASQSMTTDTAAAPMTTDTAAVAPATHEEHK